PDRDVRPIDARGAGPLGEDRDAQWVLRRTLAGDARTLDARGGVDADRGDVPDGVGDVRRRETAREDHGHLPGDGGGEGRLDTSPRPARVRPTCGVKEDP